MSTRADSSSLLLSKATRAHRKDIRVADLQHLSWTPNDLTGSLGSVRAFAEGQAQDAIRWYYLKKRPKAVASRLIRLLAIAFATTGGLIPILGSLPSSIVQQSWVLEKWGYVALGAAAACIGLDKFFGLSTGWVRYLTTAQVLQNDLYAFQLDWTRSMSKLTGAPPTSAQVDDFIQLAKNFSNRVMQTVAQETQQWVSEFQGNMADLEKTAKAQLESVRPGSLSVTVSNSDISEQPVTIEIDGVSYGTIPGNTWAIRQLSPGAHMVLITGRKEGKKLQEARMVIVPPGGTARLDLSFASSRHDFNQASGM